MKKAVTRIQKINGRVLLLVLFIFFFVIYFFSSAGNTLYDYFTRLASAFLEGKIAFSENPPWLNELIPAGQGNYFVPYPPMPAILAMPFVLILKNFPQQILAHILGAGFATTIAAIALKIRKDNLFAIWVGLFAGIGNIIWFMAANGSAWYLGQITAAFFMAAGILESVTKKRPLLVGIFLGGAYLARIHTLLALPIFIYLLRKELRGKVGMLEFAAGLTPFLGFNFAYNFARFGVIWDKGYMLIPGVLEEPWYQKGILHISYIPRHIKTMFASFPVFSDKAPFIKPSWVGLSIWITSPAFLYVFKNKLKDKYVLFTWASILLVSVPILTHGTTGFAQFGYRFALDFYPLLFFLVISGLVKEKLRWHHWTLLFLSILVNLWGVLWIHKFGWVSF